MSNTVTIDVYTNPQDTDDARLFTLSDDPFEPEATWVPKSVIEDEDLDAIGQGWIELKEWWAEKEGLV